MKWPGIRLFPDYFPKKRGKIPDFAQPFVRPSCSFGVCCAPAICKGLCHKHNMRRWRYGSPGALRLKDRVLVCRVCGEERLPFNSNPLCRKHWERYRKLRGIAKKGKMTKLQVKEFGKLFPRLEIKIKAPTDEKAGEKKV